MRINSSNWPAPAKLNLFLHVTGRRADGYHELQTLFQLLDWGDTVHIAPLSGRRIERTLAIPGVAAGNDLSIRAARLLQATAARDQGASIGVEKRIPAGAGLGGGSSDAATTLLVLNRLWACGLSMDQLAALGLELGADVPVFIRGFSAWAEGVGERLRPRALGARYYLLVFPPFSLSTADVFQSPELVRDSARIRPESFREEECHNDCEAAALALCPQLHEIITDLSAWGQPKITGTGSTLFLAMDSAQAAKRAASELKCRYNVRAVNGVDVSPLHVKLNITTDGG
jgi:4-diphosphocytidyl-2-C-methyl-D-erythritol kinase